MNGRVLDAKLGRFLSADPYVPHPASTQSFNRYSYVQNNPLSRVDPSGFGDLDRYSRDINGNTPVPLGEPSKNPRNSEPPETDRESLAGTRTRYESVGANGCVVACGQGPTALDAVPTMDQTPTQMLEVAGNGISSSEGLVPEAGYEGLPSIDSYDVTLVSERTWIERWNPLSILCSCYYNFDLDNVLNSLPALGPTGGVVGEAGVFVNSLRTAWAGRGATGTTTVYRSLNAAGDVQYVGITNNIARRAAEHLRSSGIQIERVLGGLSRSDARSVEQALIEIHGLSRSGGTLLNRINSIAPSYPAYADQLRRGYELLKTVGY